MKTIYVVPTAILTGTKPRGTWHAIVCPGDATLSLCAVTDWRDDLADDEWEALPGVRPLYVETWGQTVPPIAVTALGPFGVLATDTIRQALQKVRRSWPGARV